jgi:hypothetical protein
VILKEFHLGESKSPYFEDYARRYTDLPMLVMLKKDGERYVADRFVRASDFDGKLGQDNNPDWKTVAVEEGTARWCCRTVRSAFAGTSGDNKGKWNLEAARGARRARGEARAVADRRQARGHSGRIPVLRRHRARAVHREPGRRQAGCAGAQRADHQAEAQRQRNAGGHRVRSARGQLRHRPRPRRRQRRDKLRRQRSVHARLAGEDHRRAARRRSGWRASSPTTRTARAASRW